METVRGEYHYTKQAELNIGGYVFCLFLYFYSSFAVLSFAFIKRNPVLISLLLILLYSFSCVTFVSNIDFYLVVWEVALFPAVFLCSFLHLISVLLSVYIHACVTSRLHVSSFPFASCISFTSWFCFHLFLRLFSSVLLSPVSCFPPVCHSPDQPSVHT